MWLIKKTPPFPYNTVLSFDIWCKTWCITFLRRPQKTTPLPMGHHSGLPLPPPFANLSFLQHVHTSGPYLNRYNSDYCTRKIFGYGSEIGLAITKNMKTYFDRAEIKLSHGTSPCSNTSGDTVIKIFTLAVTLAYTKNVAIATMMIHFNRAYILLHRAFQ